MSTPSWEESLVADYTDWRWHRIMEPLCDALQRWKSGQAEHSEADRAVEAAYHERCALNSLIRQRADRAAAIIQVVDNEWFTRWIDERRHPVPENEPTTQIAARRREAGYDFPFRAGCLDPVAA